jgi:predicted DNA-binding transcriptional regulator AlpA
MDRPDLDQLPALIDVPTAAAVLGIGRSLAYDLVRTDRWPTPVLRVGKLIRIPTAALRRLLDADGVAAPHGTSKHG